MVLTAGVGSRLDPITRLVAKPAVPLAGRTLVERVLGWLQAQGARDVVLNLHARPDNRRRGRRR
jgi:NDP-sugar pyrophosphorylase family protein